MSVDGGSGGKVWILSHADVAEIKLSRAANSEFDNFHAEHLRVELARHLYVAHCEDKVIKSIKADAAA